MSKITTKNCKEKLIEIFPETNENDWKRTKKYKGDNGIWLRDFQNANSGQRITLKEENDMLTALHKDIDYSFIIYKYDASHFEWLVLFQPNDINEDYEDEECEHLREKLNNVLQGTNVENKLDELDIPNYSCDDDSVIEIYELLIKNGFNYDKGMTPNQSIIFENKVFTKPQQSNKVYSQYDLIKILAHENNSILPPHLHTDLKTVLNNLGKDEIQKFVFAMSQLNTAATSHVLKEANLELINRIANPHKPEPVSMTISEALRKKMGF